MIEDIDTSNEKLFMIGEITIMALKQTKRLKQWSNVEPTQFHQIFILPRLLIIHITPSSQYLEPQLRFQINKNTTKTWEGENWINFKGKFDIDDGLWGDQRGVSSTKKRLMIFFQSIHFTLRSISVFGRARRIGDASMFIGITKFMHWAVLYQIAGEPIKPCCPSPSS